MPFKPSHLFYFVTVAEEGQITRAAAKLHIAQPALSHAISELESQLGFRVLERHARGVALTQAGEAFLEKARAAVSADLETIRTAQSLTRAAQGTLTFGFLGVPPELTNPELVAAFKDARPDIELCFQELPFPTIPTGSWLADVDIAIASQPAADPTVWVMPLRTEPRVVVAPKSHPLADRAELTVAEVLDETFLAFDRSIDPTWAAFWSLDEHRGAPPAHLTAERSADARQRFAMIAAGHGIATLPACHAAAIVSVLPGSVAIPLSDADPTTLALVGREDRRGPAVGALLAVAKTLTEDGAADVRPLEPKPA
jgi:DNA-binding transcriptional LysR family regulator